MAWNNLNLSVSVGLDSDFYIAQSKSEGQNVLYESFDPGLGNPLTQKIGTWSKVNGLFVKEAEKYERRGNLSGVRLRVAAVTDVRKNSLQLFYRLLNMKTVNTIIAVWHHHFSTLHSAWYMAEHCTGLSEKFGPTYKILWDLITLSL